MTLKLVKQRYANDCVLAATATYLGWSYKSVLEAVIEEKSRFWGWKPNKETSNPRMCPVMLLMYLTNESPIVTVNATTNFPCIVTTSGFYPHAVVIDEIDGVKKLLDPLPKERWGVKLDGSRRESEEERLENILTNIRYSYYFDQNIRIGTNHLA